MTTVWRCEKCGAKLCDSQTFFGGTTLHGYLHYVYKKGKQRRYSKKEMIEEECGPVVPVRGNLSAYLEAVQEEK